MRFCAHYAGAYLLYTRRRIGYFAPDLIHHARIIHATGRTTAGKRRRADRLTHPCQIELMGRITVEILRHHQRLTRTAVCLKLIARLDASGDEDEAEHLTALLRMLFGR